MCVSIKSNQHAYFLITHVDSITFQPHVYSVNPSAESVLNTLLIAEIYPIISIYSVNLLNSRRGILFYYEDVYFELLASRLLNRVSLQQDWAPVLHEYLSLVFVLVLPFCSLSVLYL